MCNEKEAFWENCSHTQCHHLSLYTLNFNSGRAGLFPTLPHFLKAIPEDTLLNDHLDNMNKVKVHLDTHFLG